VPPQIAGGFGEEYTVFDTILDGKEVAEEDPA